METTILLTAVVLAAGFAYVLTCRIWPYAACRCCGGDGKLRSPFGGGAWRRCPRCKATGARLRLGRRVWSQWRQLHKEIHK